MTYYELQELIWVQVCSRKCNHHWHLLRHNIRITIFVIVESIQQAFKITITAFGIAYIPGEPSPSRTGRGSPSSSPHPGELIFLYLRFGLNQKSGFTSSSHLTDLTIPASIISHPATLSRTLWKVPRIFERRPRCDQEEQSLGKYFVFVTEDTRRMAAAQ